MTIATRLAGPEDAVRIFQMSAPMVDEAAIALPGLEPFGTLAWVLQIIQQGFICLALEEEEIVGVLALSPRQFQWDRGPKGLWFLENAWWYVAPRYRKGGTAMKLVHMAQQIADERKVPMILSLLTGNN